VGRPRETALTAHFHNTSCEGRATTFFSVREAPSAVDLTSSFVLKPAKLLQRNEIRVGLAQFLLADQVW